METFIWPTIGGVLIGLSAVVLMLTIGRIAGVSGVVWGFISSLGHPGKAAWQVLFIVGLVGGAVLLHQLTGKPIPSLEAEPIRAVIAGLLVGIGVRIGNGCTSGHGVCGMGRLSKRSFIATLTFMGMAVVTVALYNLAVQS